MNGKQEGSILNILEKMMPAFSSKYGLSNCFSIDEMEHIKINKVNSGSLMFGNIVPMYRTYVSSTFSASSNGSGAALTKEKSQIKAMGEFIERFCANNTLNDHVIPLCYNTYEEQCRLGNCLNLCELIDFDDDAYFCNDLPIAKYSCDKVISWVKGIEMEHNKEIWLPAQKVFLGIPLLNGELPYIQWLSTGLACGNSFRSAAISGIFEVVERDSFMLTWLLQLPGKSIVIDKIENFQLMLLYNHIINHLVGEDQLHMYDISKTDGIYTILTFIRNDNPNSYGLITSAASDIDAERALLKALEELCLTQAFAYLKLYEEMETIEKVKMMKEKDVRSLGDHLLYYGTGEKSHQFDFVQQTNSTINLSNMKPHVKDLNEECIFSYIVDLLKKIEKTIYCVDITRPEISECGLNVVKSIIPGYIDLDCSHNMRLLKNSRFLSFKKKYNCKINNAPHPFP